MFLFRAVQALGLRRRPQPLLPCLGRAANRVSKLKLRHCFLWPRLLTLPILV